MSKTLKINPETHKKEMETHRRNRVRRSLIEERKRKRWYERKIDLPKELDGSN